MHHGNPWRHPIGPVGWLESGGGKEAKSTADSSLPERTSMNRGIRGGMKDGHGRALRRLVRSDQPAEACQLLAAAAAVVVKFRSWSARRAVGGWSCPVLSWYGGCPCPGVPVLFGHSSPKDVHERVTGRRAGVYPFRSLVFFVRSVLSASVPATFPGRQTRCKGPQGPRQDDKIFAGGLRSRRAAP
jgi:hypothetical protein